MSHSIIDPDTHFIVDADDRSITNVSGEHLTIMQYDHNSERMTFELPRYIEGHDMYATNLVMVLFANTSKGTSASNRVTSAGVYQVTDLEIKKDHPDTLTCSWLIAREATQYVGTLKFQLQLVCHENEELGIPEYYWHTDQCDMIDVKPSLSSGNDVGEAYPDIITSMDARLSELEVNGVPQDRLATAIDEYLAEHPIEKLTDEELRAAIEAYFVDNPVDEVTDEYIEGVIAQYLKDHPVEGEEMTTQEFNTRVENYISTRPMDSNTEEHINELITEYLENNPISGTVTQEEIAAAVTQYFIDNPVTGVTEEQLAAAIEQYFAEHPIEGGGGSANLERAEVMDISFADTYSTDDRIKRYLNGDTSDLAFLRVIGGMFEFVLAYTDGSETEYGGLYWQEDITAADIVDGLPYIDGRLIGVTTEANGFPVYVYSYTEKGYRAFGASGLGTDAVSIIDSFGYGGGYDDPNWGKAFLEKTSELMKFYLLNDAGKEIGLDISNNYVDIKGLRKPTNIDFTDAGFTVTMDGGGSMAYTYTKDADGNITAITDGAGHVTYVTFTTTEASA